MQVPLTFFKIIASFDAIKLCTIVNLSSPIQWVSIKLVKIHGKSQASDI